MCSRYNLTAAPEALARHFRVDRIEPFPPRYNIAPTQPVGIVRPGARGDRVFQLVRWGLIPAWLRDPSRIGVLYSARAETAHEKPSFRGALRHRRCLVPATGYYEWRGDGGKRRPLLVEPADGGLMAFAGLYEPWLGADGSEIETMAVLTITAHGGAQAAGDRMPLIVTPEAFAAWLDCRSGTDGALEALSAESPAVALRVRPVSRRLGQVRAEGADLLVADAGDD